MDKFEKLMNSVKEIVEVSNQDLSQENANTNGSSPVGMISLMASETSKMYAEKFLNDKVLEAFKEGYIHIHDFDFYATGTTTCCQIPLGKLLGKGFYVGECYMRQPQSISTAMALASIILQSNQNNQHGGQAFANFDYDLAPYVTKSYEKHKKDILEILGEDVDNETVKKLAWKRTKEECKQACEGFVHNANSMLCRNGAQTPFTSINFGLDTSPEGRMISKCIMKAQQAGLGDGTTPIFPILIFKIKTGVNFRKGDPNYDLYELAIDTTSKRLFPNFVNCDVEFNQNPDSDDPRDQIATMGCRTRVFNNNCGKTSPVARGNLSFTTLNLPMIAQEVKELDGNLDDFYDNLDHYIDLTILQLKERMEYQKKMPAGNFQFLYQNGTWLGGEDLKPNEPIGDALNTGTLGVGFIGLAETLVILTGRHHGESHTSWDIGYDIIKHMKERVDAQARKDGLNWSVLATPAEGLAGKALRKFVAKFGVIENVSDREYFTNSNHIPVHFKIKAIYKIRLEAPFHALTLGGHICYVEVDGEAKRNKKAIETIVNAMMKYGVGYGSINHAVDTCRECGHQGIFNDYVCTECGSDDIQKCMRITGYLVGDISRWNSGKKAEQRDRVKHT